MLCQECTLIFKPLPQPMINTCRQRCPGSCSTASFTWAVHDFKTTRKVLTNILRLRGLEPARADQLFEGGGMTSFLHRQETLGAPCKPCFCMPGVP